MPKAKPAAAPEAPDVDPVEQPAVEQRPEQQPEPVAEIVSGPAAPTEDLPAAAPEAPGLVKARVLVACAHGAPDDVVEIDAELVATLRDVLDTAPEAVAYAESLKKA